MRLEPFGESHLAGVATVLADPDVQRFTRLPVPIPDGFERTWLAAYEQGRAEGTREGFAIVDDGGTFLGLALAPRIDRAAATVELGYLVAPPARGRGIATEALRLLTDWTFRTLGAQRVELHISVDNEPSKRVAARCGYVHEGTLRSVHLKQDVRVDSEIWSRLATDP